jgi:isovaleryl-CoA dehydrogenase
VAQVPKMLSTATATKKLDIFNPSEDHLMLREMLQQFVKTEVDPQALEHNRKELFNVDLFRKLGDLGLLGVTVPSEYGGSDMDATAAVIAHEELAASDPAFCLSYLAHSMLFVNNLCQNGSHEQKLKFLPKACSGEYIGGMGMSEPGAGTDVMGMGTTATLSDCGTKYTINGAKMWITNGTIDGTDTGDVFLVYVFIIQSILPLYLLLPLCYYLSAFSDTTWHESNHHPPPFFKSNRHNTTSLILLPHRYAKTGKGRGKNDITSFLVEKGMPGFTLGQKIEDKCGMRASHTAELVFDNVEVRPSHQSMYLPFSLPPSLPSRLPSFPPTLSFSLSLSFVLHRM